MTTIFLDINDAIYLIKSLTYNITTESYKIDTENLKLGKKLHFLVHQNLQILHLLKVFSRILQQQRL